MRMTCRVCVRKCERATCARKINSASPLVSLIVRSAAKVILGLGSHVPTGGALPWGFQEARPRSTDSMVPPVEAPQKKFPREVSYSSVYNLKNLRILHTSGAMGRKFGLRWRKELSGRVRTALGPVDSSRDGEKV